MKNFKVKIERRQIWYAEVSAENEEDAAVRADSLMEGRLPDAQVYYAPEVNES